MCFLYCQDKIKNYKKDKIDNKIDFRFFKRLNMPEKYDYQYAKDYLELSRYLDKKYTNKFLKQLSEDSNDIDTIQFETYEDYEAHQKGDDIETWDDGREYYIEAHLKIGSLEKYI